VAVCYIFNVFNHEFRIHSNKVTRNGLGDELHFNLHGLLDNCVNLFHRKLIDEFAVEEARKLRVESLVAANQKIGLAESWHQPALLEPEDGAEGRAEMDALHDAKGQNAVSETALHGVHPLHGPRGLLLHTRHIVDSSQQFQFLVLVADERVNHERIGLSMNRLDHILRGVEEARLWDLNLIAEILHQILHNNAVAVGKEGEDVLHKVALIVIEFLFPVFNVLC
jgi:hypothetical protein